MTMTPTVLTSRNNGVMDQPHDHEHDPAARPRRRTYTAEKKLELLAEYDAADRDGKGALLRREAIYTSHISEWRKARDRGSLHAPAARKRKSAEQVELERLRKRNERLEAELAKTKLALDITGKAHALLDLLSESADDETKRPR
jgi:transposase-like protein